MPDNPMPYEGPGFGGVPMAPVSGGGGWWDTLKSFAGDVVDVAGDVKDLLGGGGGGTPPLVTYGNVPPSNGSASVADNPWVPNVIEGLYNPGVNAPAVANGRGPSTMAGCDLYLPVKQAMRLVAPPGYVVVRPPTRDGSPPVPRAMLKRAAVSCGLWKAAAKPPIKAKDWRCLKRANAVVNRIDTIVKMSNTVTGKAKLTRSRGKR